MPNQEISIDDLKPNSHAYKDEQAKKEKKPDSVTTRGSTKSPVVRRDGLVSVKKPFSQKISEMFLGPDTSDLGAYIVEEIVVPGIKNCILDMIESMFNGGDRRDRGYRYGRRSRDDDYDYPYHSSYGGRSVSRRDRRRSSRRDRDDDEYDSRRDVDYRNIVVRYRNDAEEIVARLREGIDVYGQATIAELYDAIDFPSSYTDNNWGWTDVRDIGIRRVSSGYLIDVADARYLE